MHPAIRLCNILILIVFLVCGHRLLQSIAAAFLLALVVIAGRALLPDLGRSLWRLRWLFAGIVVLYLWLPPAAADAGMERFTAGLSEGLYRVATLAGVVGLVQCLFWFTDRHQILSGLLWWLRPLAALGVPAERVALRLCLVLETIPAANALLQRECPPSTAAAPQLRERITAAARVLADSYGRAVARADQASLDPIEIPLPVSPTPKQWLSTLSLLGLLIGVLIGT